MTPPPPLTRHPDETDEDIAERLALRAYDEACDRLPELAALDAAALAVKQANAALEATPEYAALTAAHEAHQRAGDAYFRASGTLPERVAYDEAVKRAVQARVLRHSPHGRRE